MSTKQLGVRIDRGLAARATAAAAQRSVSLAALVSAALEHELADEATAAGSLRAVLEATRAEVLRLVERLEALAPVVEVEAAPVAVEPPLLRPAPPVPMEASVVPEVPKPLSVVQRWVAEGHGRDRLFTLDQARELTDEELDLDLARRGRSREQFDAAVGGMVAEWLEGEGEPPHPADPTEAIEAMVAALKAALASGEAEAVPGS